MAYFTYNWLNGAVTSIELSSQTGFESGGSPSCNNSKAPNNRMMQAGAEIVLHASDGIDPQSPNDSVGLNDQENYCGVAQTALLAMQTASNSIYQTWDTKEIECANWNNWFRHCNDKGIYCYMSENELAASFYAWQPVVTANNKNLADIMEIWQDASNQIALNGDQATDQALLDQLIADTNNTISLTQYNNEDRELKIASTKTGQIFMPIILILLIAGMGFYFYKK